LETAANEEISFFATASQAGQWASSSAWLKKRRSSNFKLQLGQQYS